MSDPGLSFEVGSDPRFTKLIVDLLAPRLITTFIQAVELGIVINMSAHFWAHAGKERTRVKLMVAFVSSVAMFQTCVAMYDMWSIFVVNFANLSGALAVTWGLKALPMITISMAAPVQAFLMWRCWMLGSHNWFILTPLALLLLASIATSIRFTVQNFQTDFTALLSEAPPEDENLPGVAQIDVLYLFTLIFPALLDVCLTGLLLVYLLRSRSKVITKRFRKVLSQLAVIVWEAAIPPCIAAILCIITFLTFVHKSPIDLLFQGMLGQLYVISLLVTLNGFRRVREMEYGAAAGHGPTTALGWRGSWNNAGRDARIEMRAPTEVRTSIYNVTYPEPTSTSSSQSPHQTSTTATSPFALPHVHRHARKKSISKSLSSLNIDFSPVKEHDAGLSFGYEDELSKTKSNRERDRVAIERSLSHTRSSPTLVTRSDRSANTTASPRNALLPPRGRDRDAEVSPISAETAGSYPEPENDVGGYNDLPSAMRLGWEERGRRGGAASAAATRLVSTGVRADADVPVTPMSFVDTQTPISTQDSRERMRAVRNRSRTRGWEGEGRAI